MKLSTLINCLQELKTDYGDLPVRLYDNTTDLIGDLSSVEYNDDDDYPIAMLAFYSDEA